MNFAEVISNFYAAFFIFAVVAIIYLAFKLVHPYSEKASSAILSHLKGCTLDIVMWIVILGIAIMLASNLEAQNIFVSVIGTTVLNVSLITWSMIIIPITFSVHKACNRFDLRLPAVFFFIGLAGVFGLYYWLF